MVLKDIMCGDEAAAARSMLQITYPVCRDHTDSRRRGQTIEIGGRSSLTPHSSEP